MQVGLRSFTVAQRSDAPDRLEQLRTLKVGMRRVSNAPSKPGPPLP